MRLLGSLAGGEHRLVFVMAGVLGCVLSTGCDTDTARRAKDMSTLDQRSKTMLAACGAEGTKADCAAAIGKNDAPTVPNLLETVLGDLAAIEAKHGKLENVKIEVSMPPYANEGKPGLTVGLATYGGTEYRFNAGWVEANGDYALDRWMIQEKS